MTDKKIKPTAPAVVPENKGSQDKTAERKTTAKARRASARKANSLRMI